MTPLVTCTRFLPISFESGDFRSQNHAPVVMSPVSCRPTAYLTHGSCIISAKTSPLADLDRQQGQLDMYKLL